MSDISVEDFYTKQAAEARGPEPPSPPGPKKRRRLKVILIASGASLVVLAGLVVGGGALYANHLATSVHRISGIVALDAKNQAAWSGGVPGSMTVLLTDTGIIPGNDAQTGLIELLHLNASGHSGAVVSIPANAVVRVPGHGRLELGAVLKIGGPSLLIETLERLTDVRINHYSAVDFAGLPDVVGALRGVDVDVPYTTTTGGFTFHAGINGLNAADALAYVRQPAVSEIGREELQENLVRAILDKIAAKRYFVATNFRVLDAVVAALSVDSNFSNGQLEQLALRLGDLRGRDGTFVDAQVLNGSPTSGDDQPVHLNNQLDRKLWQAIRDDSVAQFAQQYPFTITPGAPG
jgi:LCP family protein required for cell wall assembly